MKIWFLLLITITGCADHTQYREFYELKSWEEYRTHDFNIRLVISETHTFDKVSKSLMFYAFNNTAQKTGHPYQLLIASRYSGKKIDTTKIVELNLQIANGQKENLLETGGIEISYHPPLDPVMPGTITLPLKDKLLFKEGEEVTITMKFIPPNSENTHTISQVFLGKKSERSYSFIDILNSV